jgi:uncharacterized Tic20 family protein
MTPDADTGTAPGEEPDNATGVSYEVSSEDRTWGILTHAAALVGFIVPFGNVLGPLLVWAIKKEDSQFVDDNGKRALNFQITWTVLLVVAALLVVVGIGLLVVPLLAIAWLILVILAIVRASDEQVYDYPLTLDLIS